MSPTVSADYGSVSPDGGVVDFYDGGVNIGEVAVSGGQAVLQVSCSSSARTRSPPFTRGTITAAPASPTAPRPMAPPLERVRPTTTTAWPRSSAPRLLGATVTFTATVSPKVSAAHGSVSPDGGLVDFYDGGVNIGEVIVSGGQAVLKIQTHSRWSALHHRGLCGQR